MISFWQERYAEGLEALRPSDGDSTSLLLAFFCACAADDVVQRTILLDIILDKTHSVSPHDLGQLKLFMLSHMNKSNLISISSRSIDSSSLLCSWSR